MADKIEDLSPIARSLAERFETGIMDMNARLAEGEAMTESQILQEEVTFITQAFTTAITHLEMKLNALAGLCGYDIQLTDEETT